MEEYNDILLVTSRLLQQVYEIILILVLISLSRYTWSNRIGRHTIYNRDIHINYIYRNETVYIV